MTMRGWWWLFLLVAAVAGCGDDTTSNPDDGGETDVATCDPTDCDEACIAGGATAGVCRTTGCECIGGGDADADVEDIEDVGPDPADDSAPPEDGTDVEADTGPVDADGDTYPEDIDCDDHDADVFPGSVRECTSACGTGTERCDAGSWVGCTAPTDCACPTPGETRLVECGRCGQASQRCGSDGVWEMPGTCMYEGECYAGEVGTEPCGLCGEHSRLCSETCAWLDWEACVDPGGECVRGTTEITREGCPAGQIQQRRCSDTCGWTTDVACTTDCILTPRTGGHQEEVCVPGGDFIMGEDEGGTWSAAWRPVHTVTLSPYFVDVFKVTNARYRACVTAGACVAPHAPGATYFLADRTTYDSHPVTDVNYADAVAFCAWDGGRLLPTEAQWEKAARGPAPRTVSQPWGDSTDFCTYINHEDCGDPDMTVSVDEHPLNVSFYGVRGMNANGICWARDWYDSAYYSSSPGADPEGPAIGTQRVFRSQNWSFTVLPDHSTLSRRWPAVPGASGRDLGLRCARQPWSR